MVFALASSLTVTTRAFARNSSDSSLGGSPGVRGGEGRMEEEWSEGGKRGIVGGQYR
jgi:hypothetical protein